MSIIFYFKFLYFINIVYNAKTTDMNTASKTLITFTVMYGTILEIISTILSNINVP